MSYPSAIARFGAAATTQRKPDDGNDAKQHVNDLSGRRARVDRGIGLRCVGRNGATDRDQGGEPDQRKRPGIQHGIEPCGVDSGSTQRMLRSSWHR